MALTYKNDMAPYAKGRRVNMEEWNTITRTKEGTDKTANGAADTGVLGFGEPALEGTGAHTCVPAYSTFAHGVRVLGIVEASQALPHPGDNYIQGESVEICESGVIGVEIDGPVTKGAPALFDMTKRKWTTSAKSNGAIIEVPGAEFDEAGAVDGDIVPLRYRRPVPSVAADK